MNTVLATGWLPKEAWSAYSPKGTRTLCFDAVLDEQGAAETTAPWRFEITEPGRQALYESRLTPGRAVIVRGRLAAKPFIKDGRPQGFTRVIDVEAIEFVKPDTHHPDTPKEDAA